MTTLCGLGAGITEAVFAVTPVETLKTRVTDDQRRGTGNYKVGEPCGSLHQSYFIIEDAYGVPTPPP